MTLAERIKKHLDENDISIRQFAKNCGDGISHQYVGQLVNEKNPSTKKPSKPSVRTLMGISRGLGITLGELINDIEDIPIIVPKETTELPANVVPFQTVTRLSMSSSRVAAGKGIPQADASDELYETNYSPEDYYAIRMSDDSMYPKIEDGDILILKYATAVEDGDIAAILIGTDETPVIRELHTDEDGTMVLIARNSHYKLKIYSPSQQAEIPVRICGRLTEIRKKL